jgi:hypothetical protein
MPNNWRNENKNNMALWLHANEKKTGFNDRPINLFEEPSPAVTATGIYGTSRGCYVLIEDNTPPVMIL